MEKHTPKTAADRRARLWLMVLAAVLLALFLVSFGWVYVNKVETPRDRASAAALAAALPGTVVAGSLHRREYQVY